VRFVSWNIENLAPWLSGKQGGLAERWTALGRPDVLCLQEVRIRPRDAATVNAMMSALPGFACFHSLNRDPRNGAFRGGRAYGVATYIRDSIEVTQRVLHWDLEGRVCLTLFHEQNVILFNVYAVNGTSKPHWDELGDRCGDRHAFKQAFVARLGVELATMQPTHRSILIGDWNIARAKIDITPRLRTEEPHSTARRRFNGEFLDRLDLIDVFRERCPETRAYTWFNPRARFRLDAARVDYALLSRALLPYVENVGIDAEVASRPGSDHAPLWVTCDFSASERARS
jgi:exodeoxyribonuclease III